MTEREVHDVSETKLRILRGAGYECEVCGNPINAHNCQLAHRVPQTKANLEKYGKNVVHHDFNLAATCSLACNAKVVVHGAQEEALVRQIRHALSQGDLFGDIYADDRLDGVW